MPKNLLWIINNRDITKEVDNKLKFKNRIT